jgi:hypothetical protein
MHQRKILELIEKWKNDPRFRTYPIPHQPETKEENSNYFKTFTTEIILKDEAARSLFD